MSFEYATRGLQEFEAVVSRYPKAARNAARLSVNDAARWGRTRAKKEMLGQVAWGSSYLGSVRDGRLRVSKYARAGDLEAAITGRFRPTSLTRFLTNRSQMLGRNRRGPAKLRVSPGSPAAIQKAFLVRLKRGNVLDDTSFNYGLAIRLKPGERIRNKKDMVPFGNGAYLLYGPSVNQVFATVREDIEPDVSGRVASEFTRQFRRLTGD